MRVSNGQKEQKVTPVAGLEVGTLRLVVPHRRCSSLGEVREQYCTYAGDGATARGAEASHNKSVLMRP
jgi:hypothetical protein